MQARACQTRICKESALPFHSRRSNDCLIGLMSGHRTCRRGGAAFAKPKHSSSFRATSSQPVRTSSQLCRTDGSRLPTCSQRPSSVAAAFMACKASSGNSTCCAAAACVGGRAPGMDFHLLAASSMRSCSGSPPRRCAILASVELTPHSKLRQTVLCNGGRASSPPTSAGARQTPGRERPAPATLRCREHCPS